ncbi:hypothetical protein [Mesorhizobium sp. RMAD-H1]|uniref:hypothetical protein n=1 Tax=Mesorhizobium sp. RMAD-H1 TaxID=2587065 RepID=UPI00160BCDF9|nr:hypothetical protein [Mesorhizobium sp. RMAD-H1]MBB2969935.1 hypothetical protein [Mesorhizobium sp. RMAD-H1]
MAAEARRQLVDFVVERAFDPVMKAKPDGRSESERRKLKDVQEATRAEIERFRDYDSARDVLVNFRRDLDSDPAKKIHAELKALDLPTINDIRDEFEEKAKKLGVEAD